MQNNIDIIVVGGGAAGLLCAGFAAKNGKDVVVVEKMPRPARKLLITGKGRCNITNNCTRDEFIDAVKTGDKFMFSAFAAFPPQDTMDFFESMGVALKTERGSRVFPVSDRAVDIADALVKFCTKNGVQIVTATCEKLLTDNGKITGILTADGQTLLAGSVVVATGGLSYPLTGSTGDGYTLAKQVGHTVTPLRPSLTSIISQNSWCKELMGLSLKNVTLTLKDKKGRVVFHEMGELLFTHFGLSGPLVLSATACMKEPVNTYTISINLKPALTEAELDTRIQRDFNFNVNRDFFNSLSALLPRKIIPVIVRLSGIPDRTKVNQITKVQRNSLVHLLQELVINPADFRPIEEAVVTSGGVSLGEINPKTMQSKIIKGLFFAGEVVDVDAYTGGFNLQIAFSTGYLAGINA